MVKHVVNMAQNEVKGGVSRRLHQLPGGCSGCAARGGRGRGCHADLESLEAPALVEERGPQDHVGSHLSASDLLLEAGAGRGGGREAVAPAAVCRELRPRRLRAF